MAAGNDNKNGPMQMQKLLSPNRRLGRLVQTARALGELEQRLRAELPPELRAGWSLARVDETELVLVVPSSAWSTRLRYSRPLILDAVRRLTGRAVRNLQIKVVPQPRRRVPRNEARLGSQAAITLRRAADGLDSSNEALSRALRRLARHARKDD